MEQNKHQIEAVKKFIHENYSAEVENGVVKSITINNAGLPYVPQKRSSEAVDLLRMISENSTFLSGTTYGIEERYVEKVNQFLERLAD
jgi:hypothetical protein